MPDLTSPGPGDTASVQGSSQLPDVIDATAAPKSSSGIQANEVGQATTSGGTDGANNSTAAVTSTQAGSALSTTSSKDGTSSTPNSQTDGGKDSGGMSTVIIVALIVVGLIFPCRLVCYLSRRKQQPNTNREPPPTTTTTTTTTTHTPPLPLSPTPLPFATLSSLRGSLPLCPPCLLSGEVEPFYVCANVRLSLFPPPVLQRRWTRGGGTGPHAERRHGRESPLRGRREHRQCRIRQPCVLFDPNAPPFFRLAPFLPLFLVQTVALFAILLPANRHFRARKLAFLGAPLSTCACWLALSSYVSLPQPTFRLGRLFVSL